MIGKPSAVIIADGGVDLPDQYAAQYGITVAPLLVHFGSEAYHSGVNITAAEFYRRLRAGGILPTTSQPSAGEYVELYRKAAAADLPILSFHLSAGLSGSIASARTARELLPDLDIRIVDTGTLSGAMAMQVLVAAELNRQGVAPDQIIARTKEIGAGAELLFTCDTLEYLRRGGRIGRVAGYVGSLLGIRPIITVDKSTGTYVACGRARTFRLAATAMAQQIADRLGEGAAVSCIILHGDCQAEAERLAELLQRRFHTVWLQIARANPALGAHVGPDTLGLAYFPGVLPIQEATQHQTA